MDDGRHGVARWRERPRFDSGGDSVRTFRPSLDWLKHEQRHFSISLKLQLPVMAICRV